ncbi:hypothetical protein JCM12214_12130 [Geobacillus vulcani]
MQGNLYVGTNIVSERIEFLVDGIQWHEESEECCEKSKNKGDDQVEFHMGR